MLDMTARQAGSAAQALYGRLLVEKTADFVQTLAPERIFAEMEPRAVSILNQIWDILQDGELTDPAAFQQIYQILSVFFQQAGLRCDRQREYE